MELAKKVLRCSGCGSTALVPNPDGTLTCAYCGTTYEITGRTCPYCGAANLLEAKYCSQCGHLMDVLGFILETRAPTSTQEHLEHVRREAAKIKAETEAASQERLRRWWAEEEERRQALAAAQAERDRQERMLLTGALAFAAIIILAILVYLLVMALT